MIDDALQNCCILMVDDEAANLRLLERLLRRAGYNELHGTTDPRQVLSLYGEYQPDLILLDLLMPYLDGYAVLERLSSQTGEGVFIPRLVLTADITPEAKNRALALGATDFLTKPFDRVELLLRIGNALNTRLLYAAQESQKQILDAKVRERTQELEIARLEVIERLARVSEFRDDETHRHTQRVGDASATLARALGVADETVELIRRIAPLHDIGKIGIPDSILLKPMQLSAAEFAQMKQHTVIGARMLEGGQSELIRMAEELALTHHERWDGRGYPRGLKRDAIPLVSRIVSIIDVFDALTHARPYKSAWPLDRAVSQIIGQRGRQFDPAVVDAFVMMLEHRGFPAPDLLDAELAGSLHPYRTA